MNYQLNGINQPNNVINKQIYYDDELSEGEEEEKEEQEEQDLEYIMQSRILSRRNRPEDERKILEKFDKYYDPLEKLNSESEDNSQLREKQKKVCCRTYFVKGENLPLENEVIEYKNYQWPIENSSFIIDKLQKLICGMLNSKGGTILIGVHDNSFKVLGLNLTIKQQEDYELFIINKVLNNQSVGIFDPKITIDDDEISLRFIPVMNEQKQWHEPSCFIRLDGLNRQQNGLNLMQFIYDKSKRYYTDNFEEIHECFNEPDRQGVIHCTKVEKVQQKEKEKVKEKVQEKYKQKVNQNKKQMQNSKYQVTTNVAKNQNKQVYYFPKTEEPLYVNKTEIINQKPQNQIKIFNNVQKLQV
ncbi:hypothetical protein PPERSA_03443 [Pseudocohnilembus persalinus]|uniref:Schlafen AlbA-2 domain-containing protein n=1 Tax=Pseudocohnilembus persalinus TaxID=266149 RepID=A0A0V0QBW1_PSEPJ|nr:hypothetical protein PPERSA_03443 [Pseudocohnilembus persalinus]|eukprot:KRW99642.1 hypothetical protein PPERSA_03443 [Pseudocohnilembus persalinus]